MLDVLGCLLREIYKGEKKMTDKIVDTIAGFLVDRTGNEIFDKWKEKRKIKKILKEDCKNIKRIFNTDEDSDLYKLIEEFIMFHAFKETNFYSSMDLTLEQEHELWERFKKHISQEKSDNYVDHNYKDKIIRCVNLHNEAINSIIMDEKSKIHIKAMQSEHRLIAKSLNQIISTLNTDTPLQDEDNRLGFIVSQVEAIMKSYRFDIGQLRRLQSFCICGTIMVLIVMAISIPLCLKYVSNMYAIYTAMMLFLMFGFLLILFWRNITIRLRALEGNMEGMREVLMKTHMEMYTDMLKTMYQTKV